MDDSTDFSGRYVSHSEQIAGKNGQAVQVTYIMIADRNGLIRKVTHLQDYLASGPNGVSPFTSSAKTYAAFFTPMLNYCIYERRKDFGICSPLQITKPMMEQYFTEYASSPAANGLLRMPNTVQKCIAVNTFSMARLVRHYGNEMALSPEDLLVTKRVYIPTKGHVVTEVPNFNVTGGKLRPGLLRDISTEAFEILLGLAFRYTPDIAFGLCAQAFAGLRPGEVCNMHQDSSIYGPSVIYTADSQGSRIPELDLSMEYVMRSDNVSVGGIKRERIQKVFPDFVPAFERAYEFHKAYLEKQSFEPEYAPMFVTGNGMAMTYDDYEKRFNELVTDYFVPELSQCHPPLSDYGLLVKERGLAPHIGRHVYTLQLVERGLTPEMIKFWRGDRSIESAMTYWAGKGELHRAAKKIACNFLDAVMKFGGSQ
ncbi:MAG: hypothetical protein IJ088_04770 [Clostridia bacterium]|nr:hypothetical protein [Clostridia bacterium]MBQ9008628.1 hypothetical protein [Clostridia bacterium]